MFKNGRFLLGWIFLFFLLGCADSREIKEDFFYAKQFDKEFGKGIPTYYQGELVNQNLPTAFERNRPFSVLQAGPKGLLQGASRGTFFYILFSQSVVAKKEIGKPTAQIKHLTLSPEEEGLFTWVGENCLLFEPSAGYFKDGEYAVSISSKFQSLRGKQLIEKYKFSFEPRLFQVFDFWCGEKSSILNNSLRQRRGVRLKKIKKIYLETLYPIPEKILKEKLEIRNGVHSLKYSIDLLDFIIEENSHRVYRIKVKEKVKEGDQLQLFFNELPLDGRFLEMQPKFKLDKINLDYDYRRLFLYPTRPNVYFLNMEFSSPVKISSLENKILINGEVVEQRNLAYRGNRILYLGKIKPIDQLNRLIIKEGVQDIYGRKIKIEESHTFSSQMQNDYLFSPYYKMNYISSNKPELNLEVVGEMKGRWNFAPVDGSLKRDDSKSMKLSFQIDYSTYPYWTRTPLIPFLSSIDKNSVFSGKIELEEKDVSRAKSASVEYFFQMTSLGLTVGVSKNSISVFVVNLETAKIVKKADLSFRFEDGKVFSVKTGQFGVGTFNYSTKEIDLRKIPFLLDVDGGDSRISYRIKPQGLLISGESQTPLRRAFISADKKTYETGAQVTLSIADLFTHNGILTPAKGNYELQLKRLQPYPRTYLQKKGKIHSSGLFQMSYELPSSLPSGQYAVVYTGSDSVGEVHIEIKNTEAFCEMIVDREEYSAGELFNFNIRWNTSQKRSVIGSETILSMTCHPFKLSKDLLPWSDAYIGFLDWQQPPKTINRMLYSDANGSSSFRFNSVDLYNERNYVPYRLEVTPRMMIENRMMGGAGKVVNLYPSTFMIAGRLLDSTKGTAVKAKRKVTVAYQFVPCVDSFSKEDLGARVTAEVFLVGSSGELLEGVKKITKKSRQGKGSFSFSIIEPGLYRIILKSEDSMKNPVVSEIPLHILGEKTKTDFFSMAPLTPSVDISKGTKAEAKIWVNLPRISGFDRGKKMAIIKEKEGAIYPFLIPSFTGSNFFKIPIEASDFPGVKIHLVSWDSANELDSAFSIGDYRYLTTLASCQVKIEFSSHQFLDLEVLGLDNLVAGSTKKLDFLVKSEDPESEGRFMIHFLKKDSPFYDAVPKIDQFFIDKRVLTDPILFYDTRQFINGGRITSYSQREMTENRNTFLLMLADLPQTEPISFYGNRKKEVQLLLPQKSGVYEMIISGVWNGTPFTEAYSVTILGEPKFSIDMPDRLLERDFSIANVSIAPFTIAQEDLNAQISFTVIDKISGKKSDGIFINPSIIELTPKNDWKSSFEISANKIGGYEIEAEISYSNVNKREKFALDIFSNDWNLRTEYNLFQSHKTEEVELEIFFPLDKVLKGAPVSITSKIQIGDFPSYAWATISETLKIKEEDSFLDAKIAPVFYWFIAGKKGMQYGVENSLNQTTAIRLLKKYTLIQKSNGGYPLYFDKNFESDYYTTVRIADLLQTADVNYYKYVTFWSLMQYLKQAFKGTQGDDYSFYLKSYAAWVLARYKENVVLNTKNLLESGEGNIGEIALAGMAMLTAGNEHGIDVNEYLQEPLLKILYRFDPDLLEQRAEKALKNSNASLKNDSNFYGYNCPKNETVEAALAFLFLDLLGGHTPEALQALDELLHGDFEDLNYLDGTFVLRALVAADSRGYLNEYRYSPQKNLIPSFNLRVGDKNLFEFDIKSGRIQEEKNPLDFFHMPTSKNPYWVSYPHEKFRAKLDFDFNLPVETIGEVESGYSILSLWSNGEGETIAPTGLKVGEPFFLRLLLSSNSGEGPIQVVIPSRFSSVFDLESIITLNNDLFGKSEEFGTSNRFSVKRVFSEKELVLIYSNFERQFDEVLLRVVPKYPGIYPFKPVVIENLYDNRLFGQTAGTVLTVKP